MSSECSLPTEMAEPNRNRPGIMDAIARHAVFAALECIRTGSLTLRTAAKSHHFGEAGAHAGRSATIMIHDARAFRAIAFGGTVGAGEAYMKGWWSADDCTALVRLFLANDESMYRVEGGLGRLFAPLHHLLHVLRANTRAGSRRNIAAHYDLGNEFYRLFLDETMMYSSGLFEAPESTLKEASIAKLDRICRLLALEAGDHVVEIGTGWGGFAIHAATNYGCRVTTTTISRRQHDHARERIDAAGLGDRITLLQDDYRDLRGQFDKLASIEMIEAIGHRQFNTYFRKCADLLKPNGAACIQAITIADRHFDAARRDVDFIKRYIFPGCCIPSIGAMAQSIARASDLTIDRLDDFGPHYARTLREWRKNFHANIDRVRTLGMTEAFIRMWDFYLHYCEGGFAERRLGVVQMLMRKPNRA